MLRNRQALHAEDPVMGGTHRIVRNSAFNLAGQAGYALLYTLAIVILARSLGTGQFGAYFTIFAISLVVQLLAEAGLSTVLTRRLVRNQEDRERIVAEAVGLFAGVCVVSVAVLALVGRAWAWWRDDPAVWLAFLAAGVACAGIQAQRFCTGVLQASEMFGFENLARVLQGATFTGLTLWLLRPGQASLTAAFLMLAASHLVAAGLLLRCLYSQRRLPWPPVRPRLSSWLSEAVPLGFGDVVRGLTWQLDTVLLGLMQPAAVVGIYSVAYRPLGPLNWVPRAVLTATFPSFARLADNQALLERAFSNSVRLLTVLSLPIVITLFLCAEPFILLLAGPAYLEAAIPLRIIIWITILTFLSMHFRFLLTALGSQQIFARLVLGVCLLKAVLEIVLIPFWSYFGACAGSLIGELAFAVTGLVLCQRSYGIHGIQWRILARALVPCAAMAAVLWPVRGATWPVLIPLGIIAAGVYLGLCVRLRVIRKEEVRHFLEMLSGMFQPLFATRVTRGRISPARPFPKDG